MPGCDKTFSHRDPALFSLTKRVDNNMTKIKKPVFDKEYSYKGFNFIIKIIQKEWGLEGAGFEDDLRITSSKTYINPTSTQFLHQLLRDSLKAMIDNIEESLRVYADYGKNDRKRTAMAKSKIMNANVREKSNIARPHV